jgi:hypothetical protein
MRPETLFARAVLAPPAKTERPSPAARLNGDRVQAPGNLLQRVTQPR